MKRWPTLSIVPFLLVATVLAGGCKDMPSSATIRREIDDSTLRRIENRMSGHGWTQIVRDRDKGDNTWIFSRHDESGSIRGIVVVDLDGDELSIIGVEGRLNEVLIDAITDDSDGFSSLFGT